MGIFFFLEENYLVGQTRSVWDCKPSYKPKPFPFGSLIFSFWCTKNSSICLAYTSKTESRGSTTKPLFRLGTCEPQGTPKTLPLQKWGVTPLHFPCVTDACVCKHCLSQPMIFDSCASKSPLHPSRGGGVKGRWGQVMPVFWSVSVWTLNWGNPFLNI